MLKGIRATARLLVALMVLVLVAAPTFAQVGLPIQQRFRGDSREPPLANPPAVPPAVPRAGDTTTPPPADPPTPVVSIHVVAPDTATPGQELQYRLQIDNRSTAAAHHVLVRDRLPATVHFKKAEPEPTRRPGPEKKEADYEWDLGTLPGGAHKEIVLTVVPTGDCDIDNPAYVVFEHGQKVKTRLSVPQLRVREIGPTEGVLEDVLKFRVEITNVGTVEAADVTLTNTLPDGLKFSTSMPAASGNNPFVWNLGKIAPGKTVPIEYQAVTDKVGVWSTQLRATARGGLTADATTTVTVGEPKMSVVVTGPASRGVNRPATYQITVSNPGSIALNHVVVSDEIPDKLTIKSIGNGGKRVGTEVRWDLGTIPPGGRRTAQVVLQADKVGVFENRVDARADGNQKAGDSVKTFFESSTQLKDLTRPNDKDKWIELEAPTMMLEIEKGTDPLDVGREATYIFRILNATPKAGTNLGLTIVLPPELEAIEGSGPTKVTTQKPQQVVFAELPVLQVKQEIGYSVRVRAVKAGTGPIRVEMTGDSVPPGAPIVQTDKVTVLEAAK